MKNPCAAAPGRLASGVALAADFGRRCKSRRSSFGILVGDAAREMSSNKNWTDLGKADFGLQHGASPAAEKLKKAGT